MTASRLSLNIALSLFCFLVGLSPLASADSLQDALVSAYNNHPLLKAEQARLRAIDENYIQARAQSRPTIAITGSAAGSAVRTPFNFGPVQGAGNATITGTPIAGQLEVLQPIYQGGRLKAQRRQALTAIMAARESLRQTEQDILLAAATAYVDVIRDEHIADIRRNNVRVLSRQKEAAQVRFDVGAGTRTDTAQAGSRLAAADIGLAAADAQLAASRAIFRRSVGRDPVALNPIPQMIVPDTPEEMLTIALENNPRLNAARYNREASKYDVNIARAATKPSVSLSATAAAQREQILGFSQAEALSLTAQVSIPIFTSGLNQSRIRQAENVSTQRGYEVKDAEQGVTETLYRLWAQLDAAQRTLVASETQINAAKLAFEGVELEQEVGTRTVLDVLDAEQEVREAEINYINSQRELDVAIFQILAIMGTFTSEGLQLPADIYNPSDAFEGIRADGLHNLAQKRFPSLVNESVFDDIEPIKPTK